MNEREVGTPADLTTKYKPVQYIPFRLNFHPYPCKLGYIQYCMYTGLLFYAGSLVNSLL